MTSSVDNIIDCISLKRYCFKKTPYNIQIFIYPRFFILTFAADSETPSPVCGCTANAVATQDVMVSGTVLSNTTVPFPLK